MGSHSGVNHGAACGHASRDSSSQPHVHSLGESFPQTMDVTRASSCTFPWVLPASRGAKQVENRASVA